MLHLTKHLLKQPYLPLKLVLHEPKVAGILTPTSTPSTVPETPRLPSTVAPPEVVDKTLQRYHNVRLPRHL